MKKKSNPPIERETTLSSINLLKADNLPFDIKAEVLARLIATKFELNTEDVLFQSRNYFQRWGRRDVLEISEGFSLQTEKKQWVFDVSREGMFDALPESVFLHPDDEYRDSEHRIKELTKQEQEARKFLRPFEQMFYWMRLENEAHEHFLEGRTEVFWQRLLDCGNSLLAKGAA